MSFNAIIEGARRKSCSFVQLVRGDALTGPTVCLVLTREEADQINQSCVICITTRRAPQSADETLKLWR